MDEREEILAGVKYYTINNTEQQMTETREIFEGTSFKYPPVSKEDYVNAYEEYVRRCSS